MHIASASEFDLHGKNPKSEKTKMLQLAQFGDDPSGVVEELYEILRTIPTEVPAG